eukprot:773533-Prorocentrum_minimum.AAC.2
MGILSLPCDETARALADLRVTKSPPLSANSPPLSVNSALYECEFAPSECESAPFECRFNAR